MAKEALDMVSQVANMKVRTEEMPPPYEVLLEKVKNIDCLLCLLTDKIDANLISTAPKLKVISNMAVGYDNIDIREADNRDVFVGFTPGVLTETTADSAFTLLITTARRMVEADAFTRKGHLKT